MKKPIFSLFLFLSFSSLVHAQWVTNGTNTITSTTNSVGIGTTTPASPLHVQISNLGLNIIGGFRNSNNGAGTGTTTAGTAVGIGFLNEGNGNWWKAAIVHERTNAYGVGSLHFLVNNSIDNSTVTLNDAKMTIQSSGNVGIGTTAPAAKLHIFNQYDTNQTTGLKMFYQGTWGTPAYATNFRFIDLNSTESGKVLQVNGTGIGIGYDPPAWSTADKLYVNGNVGIGTTDPKGYMLAVAGSAIATSMTVKLYANWPDYVFKKDYQLPSLQEVKTYIDQNRHLPEVPSQQQIAKDGLNLGEMNKLLMKKVEELTLYMIEMKEEIKDLQKQNKDLKKQIK